MPPDTEDTVPSEDRLQMREALLWAQLAQLGIDARRVQVHVVGPEDRADFPEAFVWVRPSRWWWPRGLWRWALECVLSGPRFRVEVLFC